MFNLICWFEIPVFDFERAVSFYSNVFGHIRFDFDEFLGMRHAIFKSVIESSPLKITGALVEHKEKPKELFGPLILFDANTGMESIIERIRKNGGEILTEKTPIRNYKKDGSIVIPKTLIDGKYGYYAYFRDCEGNKMGLYSNS